MSRDGWHEGERALQARAGVREELATVGRRVLRDFMPDQHRALFRKLPFLIAGSLDERDRPWASILVGPPGFVSSPDARTLSIEAEPLTGDPLDANLATGAPVGLLGIELETRRRNRANGRIAARPKGRFMVAVEQSFGNCPKYIQARAAHLTEEPRAAPPRPPRTEGPRLSPEAVALVRRADTFFVASASPAARGPDPAEGVDVSHRGGRTGFVSTSEDERGSTLTIPDYQGNFFFNTLGNLARNPRAGLLFVDFDSGALLQLSGSAELVWDGPVVDAHEGAERAWIFRPEIGIGLDGALPLRWSRPIFARELRAPDGG